MSQFWDYLGDTIS